MEIIDDTRFDRSPLIAAGFRNGPTEIFLQQAWAEIEKADASDDTEAMIPNSSPGYRGDGIVIEGACVPPCMRRCYCTSELANRSSHGKMATSF